MMFENSSFLGWFSSSSIFYYKVKVSNSHIYSGVSGTIINFPNEKAFDL